MRTVNPYITPGMTVAVMGCGVTGRAAALYARACGAEVLVSDARSEEAFAETSAWLDREGIGWECGHTLDFLLRAQLVLLSPGIAIDHPLAEQLRRRGVAVMGELAVVAPALRSEGVQVIAVTGSNGKTTVTSLLGEVLAAAGREVFVGGNIGVSLYEYCLGERPRCEVVVAEVSSFQLETAGDFAPDVAILLNITPDHLDRHHDLAGYIAAKMTIFARQDAEQLAVVNGDDRNCRHLSADCRAAVCSFGRGPENAVIISGEQQLLVAEDGKQRPLSLPLGTRGFAAENFAAAVPALRRFGVSFEMIEHCFATFRRPPHRMELVAEIDGVRYINDSKATNTGAVIGALRQCRTPVVLIAGGRDKGEDYRQLREQVEQRVKAVILLGESAGDIERALAGSSRIYRVRGLEQAVALGRELAGCGESVLLSPACASFDMFTGYEHRGEVFRSAVAALEAE